MIEKKLWNRKLACGHNRTTSVPYALGDYTKPRKRSMCFCIVCFKIVKIKEVEQID